MAIVNALRFDEYSGAIISDEESWKLRRRRTLFCDNVHNLFDPEVSDALHMEAVYGGIGTPAIHYETVTKTQRQLTNMFQKRADPTGKKQMYQNMADVSKVVMENLQNTIRRRADDRLKFAYGFTSHDLNRGYFEAQGERIDIKQDAVKSKALEIAMHAGGVIGAMSSGMASIAGNETGGSELYRASKAALNMLMRSFTARHTGDSRGLVLIAAGWVRTDMGGPDAPLGVEDSIPGVVDVIASRAGKPGLRFLDRLGRPVPW